MGEKRRRAFHTCKVDRCPLLLLPHLLLRLAFLLFPTRAVARAAFTLPYNASACITYNSVISPGSFLT